MYSFNLSITIYSYVHTFRLRDPVQRKISTLNYTEEVSLNKNSFVVDVHQTLCITAFYLFNAKSYKI